MKKTILMKNTEKAKRVVFTVLIVLSLLIPSFGLADNQDEPLSQYIEDDRGSSKVIVDDIISPGTLINTGEHFITASFTSVGININGLYDENEPWIEHPNSPDINGTPKAHFYTSCDNDYIYLAFERFPDCDPIIAGELFIDINANNNWESNIDTFLTFNYPFTKIYNETNEPIEDSKVAWGDFLEIQIPITLWPECNHWGYRISSECGQALDNCLVTLPSEPITAQISIDYSDSYFDITLSNIYEDANYDVEDGVYNGWCIERDSNYDPEAHEVNLFSSACDEHLLMGIPLENWSKVNYILNHRDKATYTQVQNAIWYFANLGYTQPDTSDPVTQQLMDAANTSGVGYIPPEGGVVAVLLKPVNRYQHTIIEVGVPEDDCSWNPNWGNNTHPSSTPPEDEFLDFSCIYWGDCECGISFKGLADIWQIHPGECHLVYETDFENKTKVADEWVANSFDENDDTWNLSTNRSRSGSYSFHCTNLSQYYGNANDVLEMKHGLDLQNVVNVTFSFWHWAEGDSYEINGQLRIADYGTVEFYVPDLDGESIWIPLQDLGLTTLYYNNDWKQTSFTIDRATEYNYNEVVYTGANLLQDGNKFRFNWTSDAQFQYEGWYIDDVSIIVCEDDWYDPIDDLIWQSQSLPPNHWCIPWNSTIEKTFPLKWNATEGKYLLKVCLQQEPPWQPGSSCMEQIITVGDIHDVAVIDIDSPEIVEPGDDVQLRATIKNVGTMDETDVEVHAKLRKDGTGSPIWQRTKIIDFLNVSEEYIWEFNWEDATYCDYQLEVTAFIEDDAVPANNTKYKWILVADTLLFDKMNDDSNWLHVDLTGGEGHWNICTSGYEDYLWCGLQETTKYGNNWNDVTMINRTFDLSNNHTLTISFKTQYDIDENDFGIVEASPDNGRRWYQLPSPSFFTGYSDWTTITITQNISTLEIDEVKYQFDEAKFRFRFYSNESITARGWIINDILIQTDGYTIFEDDFDTTGTDNWVIERLRAGDWWQLVTKEKPDDPDNNAWWCGDEISKEYLNNLNNALVLKDSVDLTKAFGAHLLFNTWYELEDGDVGYVEISKNDGNTWTTSETITGTSGGSWEEIWIPLNAFLLEVIKIRFRFISDDSDTAEGWYIDDVRIIAKIDETPPTSTAKIDSGTMGENDWFTSNVVVSISATDEESGVKDIFFKLNGGSQQTYTAPISLTQDGQHTIEYWAVDNVGNIEPVNTFSVKIDKTNPETPVILRPDAGIYLRDRKIWPLINFSLFNWTPPRVFGAITVSVETSDATSGVNNVAFFIDEDFMDQVETTPYEWVWDETVFFKHTLTVRVTDNAGNTAETSKEIIIFNLNLFG